MNETEKTILDEAIPPEINIGSSALGDDINQMVSSAFFSNMDDIPPIETKKIKKEDTSYLYDYISKYKIEDINLSNLQKLHEKELINVNFFTKLRSIFKPKMIKSKLMKGLGIRESYTGFHEFMKGERADLPNVGICNIAKTVGYDVMIVPIPEDITKSEMDRLNLYRESFLLAVEKKIIDLNIPETRTRSKDKEKQKAINTSFMNQLGKTEDDHLKDLLTFEQNEGASISADAIFDDNRGEIVMERKEFTKKYKEEAPLEYFDASEFVSNKLEFNPNEIIGLEDENLESEIGMGTFEFAQLSDLNTGMIDMSGYTDSLEDLRKIDEDEDFTFNEEK